MPSLHQLVSTVLIAAVILSHSFLSFADFFGGVATADFLRRADASCSVATHLEPLEATFVTLVGLPHFVIVLLFVCALIAPTLVPLRTAAFASAVVHGVWSAHLVIRKEQWSGIFCVSDTTFVDWRFFVGAHVLWTVVSLILLLLLRPKAVGKKKTH